MNKKVVFIAVIMFLFGISIGYAAEVILSKDISFSNGATNLKANNVQDAIEELYNKTINDSSCKNVSAPKLGEGLVPVTIENDGTVKYADTTKSWYNYCDKRWANVVILEDGTNYKVGDTISETDIQSYFVWIPKYKYKLWNVDTPIEKVHEIEIVFDETNTTDVEGVSCKTPMASGESGNCNNGEYMTHPAFISMGVNGFWVGKFETGYKGATSVATSQVNANDTNKVIIKPNVYSWRGITVKNIFETSYNYKRNLESHMMKNTEWGAVAYLSHSKYGINTEVRINNNSNFITGYAATDSADQSKVPGTYGTDSSVTLPYNTSTGYKASTTGNITGIYDMSGGTHEYTASLRNETYGSSGFDATTLKAYNSKYYDAYDDSSEVTTYSKRILGDATGEMGPFYLYQDADNNNRFHNSWYDDFSYFFDSSYPWLSRGGYYYNGELAGQFNFSYDHGGAIDSFGLRLVLTK